LRFTQPPLEATWLVMKFIKRPVKSVLWLKTNTMTHMNLTVKLVSRLNKLELTASTVGRPILQVIETQV